MARNHVGQSNSNETIFRYCRCTFHYSKHRICLSIDQNRGTHHIHTFITREIFSSITTWIMNTYGCNVFFLKTPPHYVPVSAFSDGHIGNSRIPELRKQQKNLAYF